MKKINFKLLFFIVAVFSFIMVFADENNNTVNDTKVEQYITKLYKQIDFSKCERLSYTVFDKAYRGYLNLSYAGKLNPENEILTICNFDLPSTENRMWVIDLQTKKVLFNTYVAHGQGTGEDCAEAFSNKFDSHQSSLGFFVTTEVYDGEHGASLRLAGMDFGFNDAALDRGIVVHGADYVCSKFITNNQRLGRSWGCPAVDATLSLPIINTIKDGTCLFAYFPDNDFLQSSTWLNTKITHLPDENKLEDIVQHLLHSKTDNANATGNLPNKNAGLNNIKISKIEYTHNGIVDSVKTITIKD